MSVLQVAFVGKLVFELSSLEPLLLKHLEENNDVIYPYQFMSAVSEHCLSKLTSKTDLQETLGYLESFFSEEDDDVSNLIALGFVENFVAGIRHKKMLDVLPPRLKSFAKAWKNQDWK